MSDFHEVFKNTYGFEPPNKHENYESKICKSLMQSIGIGNVTSLVNAGEVTLQLPNILSKYFGGSIGIGCAKLKNDVSLQSLISKKMTSTELWEAYTAVLQNFPAASTQALVFDKHGDGLGDMVMHNNCAYTSDKDWCLTLWNKEDGPYFIQSLKVFLVQIGQKYAR